MPQSPHRPPRDSNVTDWDDPMETAATMIDREITNPIVPYSIEDVPAVHLLKDLSVLFMEKNLDMKHRINND